MKVELLELNQNNFMSYSTLEEKDKAIAEAKEAVEAKEISLKEAKLALEEAEESEVEE